MTERRVGGGRYRDVNGIDMTFDPDDLTLRIDATGYVQRALAGVAAATDARLRHAFRTAYAKQQGTADDIAADALFDRFQEELRGLAALRKLDAK